MLRAKELLLALTNAVTIEVGNLYLLKVDVVNPPLTFALYLDVVDFWGENRPKTKQMQ